MKKRHLPILAATICLAFAGCSKKKEKEAAVEEVGEESFKFLFDYLRTSNAKDAQGLKEFYAEDVVTEYVGFVPEARIEGRDALVDDNFKESWKAFPDSQFEHLRILINGKEIVFIVLATGTNTGPLMNLPPTEERIGILSGYHWTLNDEGKVASEVVYTDQNVVPGQLGLLTDVDFRPAEPPNGNPPKIAIATHSDEEQANVAVIESMLEALNSRDVDKLAEHYSGSALYSYMPYPEDHKGRKQIAEMYTDYLGMSSDLKASHEWIWSAEDYVAAHTIHSGTNDGDLPDGTEATGKPFKTEQLDIFKVVNGKITRHWAFTNAMSFAVQVGLVQVDE